MYQTIRQWGNSYAVRIPRELLKKTGLTLGATVMISPKKKSLSIKPISKKVQLEDLVGKITPHNRHSPFVWGKAKGREVW